MYYGQLVSPFLSSPQKPSPPFIYFSAIKLIFLLLSSEMATLQNLNIQTVPVSEKTNRLLKHLNQFYTAYSKYGIPTVFKCAMLFSVDCVENSTFFLIIHLD